MFAVMFEIHSIPRILVGVQVLRLQIVSQKVSRFVAALKSK